MKNIFKLIEEKPLNEINLILDELKESGNLEQRMNSDSEEKLDDNSSSKMGYTPFLWAVKCNKLDIVQYLAKLGSSIDVVGPDNMNALHIAASNDATGILEFLLSNGLEVNAVCDHGMQAIHFAAREGFVGNAKILIKHYADVNAQSEFNLTPLHYAVNNNRIEMCQFLLENGAINMPDASGNTPQMLAEQLGFTNIANAFLMNFLSSESSEISFNVYQPIPGLEKPKSNHTEKQEKKRKELKTSKDSFGFDNPNLFKENENQKKENKSKPRGMKPAPAFEVKIPSESDTPTDISTEELSLDSQPIHFKNNVDNLESLSSEKEEFLYRMPPSRDDIADLTYTSTDTDSQTNQLFEENSVENQVKAPKLDLSEKDDQTDFQPSAPAYKIEEESTGESEEPLFIYKKADKQTSNGKKEEDKEAKKEKSLKINKNTSDKNSGSGSNTSTQKKQVDNKKTKKDKENKPKDTKKEKSSHDKIEKEKEDSKEEKTNDESTHNKKINNTEELNPAIKECKKISSKDNGIETEKVQTNKVEKKKEKDVPSSNDVKEEVVKHGKSTNSETLNKDSNTKEKTVSKEKKKPEKEETNKEKSKVSKVKEEENKKADDQKKEEINKKVLEDNKRSKINGKQDELKENKETEKQEKIATKEEAKRKSNKEKGVNKSNKSDKESVEKHSESNTRNSTNSSSSNEEKTNEVAGYSAPPKPPLRKANKSKKITNKKPTNNTSTFSESEINESKSLDQLNISAAKTTVKNKSTKPAETKQTKTKQLNNEKSNKKLNTDTNKKANNPITTQNQINTCESTDSSSSSLKSLKIPEKTVEKAKSNNKTPLKTKTTKNKKVDATNVDGSNKTNKEKRARKIPASEIETAEPVIFTKRKKPTRKPSKLSRIKVQKQEIVKHEVKDTPKQEEISKNVPKNEQETKNNDTTPDIIKEEKVTKVKDNKEIEKGANQNVKINEEKIANVETHEENSIDINNQEEKNEKQEEVINPTKEKEEVLQDNSKKVEKNKKINKKDKKSPKQQKKGKPAESDKNEKVETCSTFDFEEENAPNTISDNEVKKITPKSPSKQRTASVPKFSAKKQQNNTVINSVTKVAEEKAQTLPDGNDFVPVQQQIHHGRTKKRIRRRRERRVSNETQESNVSTIPIEKLSELITPFNIFPEENPMPMSPLKSSSNSFGSPKSQGDSLDNIIPTSPIKLDNNSFGLHENKDEFNENLTNEENVIPTSPVQSTNNSLDSPKSQDDTNKITVNEENVIQENQAENDKGKEETNLSNDEEKETTPQKEEIILSDKEAANSVHEKEIVLSKEEDEKEEKEITPLNEKEENSLHKEEIALPNEEEQEANSVHEEEIVLSKKEDENSIHEEEEEIIETPKRQRPQLTLVISPEVNYNPLSNSGSKTKGNEDADSFNKFEPIPQKTDGEMIFSPKGRRKLHRKNSTASRSSNESGSQITVEEVDAGSLIKPKQEIDTFVLAEEAPKENKTRELQIEDDYIHFSQSFVSEEAAKDDNSPIEFLEDSQEEEEDIKETTTIDDMYTFDPPDPDFNQFNEIISFIKNDMTHEVSGYLEKNEYPSLYVTSRHSTLLHVAAHYNKKLILKLLLKKCKEVNAPIDAVDTHGMTALARACEKGFYKCAKILIKEGANPLAKNKRIAAIDTPNFNGYTILHREVAKSNVRHVKFLLEHGANPDAVDSDGIRAIDFRDEYGNTMLYEAAENEEYPILCFLLEYHANPGIRSANGLLPIEVVESMENGEKKQQFMDALICQMVDIPDAFLMRVKSDKNLFNRNKDKFLEKAIQSVSLSVIPFLLEHGCNCNELLSDRSTYLHLAAKIRRLSTEKEARLLSIIKILIDNGCLFTFDQSGRTPLHYAAENCHERICEFFIMKYGIHTLEQRDFANRSPIDFAQTKRNGNFLLAIKERIHADKEEKENEFISKIQDRALDDQDIAKLIKRDYSRALKELVKSGRLDANQKLENYPKMSLIHLCAIFNSLDCMFFLITHNAEANAKDLNGMLPYQVAAKNNSIDVLISFVELNIEIKEKDEAQVLKMIGKKNEAYYIFLEYFRFIETENAFYRSMDVSIIERSKNIFDKLIFFDECISRPEAAKRIVLASSVNVNAANLFGENAIYHIIRWSNETEEEHELIRLLVSKGCNINAQRKDGNTALHAVFITKKFSFIKTLKECGCDDSIPNDNGTIVSKLALSK